MIKENQIPKMIENLVPGEMILAEQSVLLNTIEVLLSTLSAMEIHHLSDILKDLK